MKSEALAEGEFLRLVSFNQIERELIPEHLSKYCGTLDIAHENGKNSRTITTDSGLKMRVQKSVIVKNKITITTLVSFNFFLIIISLEILIYFLLLLLLF